MVNLQIIYLFSDKEVVEKQHLFRIKRDIECSVNLNLSIGYQK